MAGRRPGISGRTASASSWPSRRRPRSTRRRSPMASSRLTMGDRRWTTALSSVVRRLSSRKLLGDASSRVLVRRASWRGLAGQLRALWGEPALLLALLLIAFVAHAFNMFNFPAFTYNGDEGIYTGQALAVLRDGQLASYTYWYDHAPAGWILLAAWMVVSGGPLAF